MSTSSITTDRSRWVSTQGLTGAAPLAILSAATPETVDDLLAKDARTLTTPFVTEDGTEVVSVSRLLSHLFVRDEAPRFALVLAGPLGARRRAGAVARGPLPRGQPPARRRTQRREARREIDRALTCLEAHSLGPDADGNIWWTEVLEDSVKHTVGVSKDLRDGVRLSIEIIANEVVRRRAAQGLEPLPQEQAQPLAIQSLRYLYRILFLLYAEASPELEVLPVGAAEYDQGYSLDRLRDLTLVDLHTEQGKAGTHLYESLATLFRARRHRARGCRRRRPRRRVPVRRQVWSSTRSAPTSSSRRPSPTSTRSASATKHFSASSDTSC